MKVAVFVSVERRDNRITTFSSIKEIQNIEDKQQLDEAVKLQIENNKHDKDWMGGKVEKIIVYEVEVPYIPIVEEIRPTRFNYLLEN